MDIDAAKIERLQKGDVPIYEPGLDKPIDDNASRLSFTTSYDELLDACHILFIAVDTPPSPSGDADLSRVQFATTEIARRGGRRLLVMKSTVPVGTGEKVVADLEALGATDITYASNPEFLREGVAIQDFLEPDRVVIGASRKEDGDLVEALYRGIDTDIVRTSVPTAEMVKYASTAFLATKISFINEIANVCEQVGAIVRAYDPMVDAGDHPLFPGVVITDEPLQALEGADAAVLVTEWPEFARLDWSTAAAVMRRPLLIDGRNFVDPAVAAAAGLAYEGIGLGDPGSGPAGS